MKVFDYLFYKLYRAAQKSSVKEISAWAASVFTGALIGINITVLSAFLAKFDIAPFILSSKKQAVWYMVVIIFVSIVLFLLKDRYKTVVERYSSETERSRIRGSVIVWTYVILSFLMIFVVAFFRPGKI